MADNLIKQALETATDTREFRVGAGIIGEVSELFNIHFDHHRALIVADETTFRACGARVLAAFAEAGIDCAKPQIFPAEPRLSATYEAMCAIRDALSLDGDTTIAVAVGAGTINDLCKRASEELSRPYMCVATAASVDGYAAFGAPITKDGFKKTWPCAAPRAILADTDVLTAAPKDLASSGYADLLAKVPSGADWILADAVLSDPIREDVWATTQIPLRDWVNAPEALFGGDSDAMTNLFTGLAMTGFAMQTTHTSRPASGAEHLFSHYWEMIEVVNPKGEHPSHGEKVGIGSLMATYLIERFFAKPFTRDMIDAAIAAYPAWEKREAFIRSILPSGQIADEAVEASRAKHLTDEALRKRLEIIADRFNELKERVEKQLLPLDELKRRLKAAGAPTTPEEIGVTPKALYDAFFASQMIRNRFTIVDLVYEAGLMPELARDAVNRFS